MSSKAKEKDVKDKEKPKETPKATVKKPEETPKTPKEEKPKEEKEKPKKTEEKPKEAKPKEAKPREEKPREEKPKEGKPKEEKPKEEKPKEEKPKKPKKEENPKEEKKEEPKQEDQTPKKLKEDKPKEAKSEPKEKKPEKQKGAEGGKPKNAQQNPEVMPSDLDAKISEVSVHVENDPVPNLPLALPNLMNETQGWGHLEAILNPRPVSQDLPEDYCCSITSRLMREPVTTSDGQTYEREAIEEWLENHDTSPLGGNARLKNKTLTPVLFVKNAVDKLLLQHPDLRDSKEWYLPESWVRELGQACEAGNEAAIRELVGRDRRLLVHTFGSKSMHEGKTALQLAVLSSKPRALEVIVEQLEKREEGLALAALLQTNAQGLVPLHQAVLAKRSSGTLLQVMSWMGKALDLVATPPDWPLPPHISHDGVTDLNTLQILHTLNKALLWSVSHRDLEKAGCLLRLRANPNAHDDQGKRMLHLAVMQQAEVERKMEKQDQGLVKLLLRAGADPNALNVDGEDAPLHFAIREDLLATALELTRSNARLDLRLKNGTSPLHLVAEKASTGLADALWGEEAKKLSVGELEATSGPEAYTALHCAARSGSSEMLLWLVVRGARITVVNAKEQSILHVAALHNRKPFAEQVVKLTTKFTAGGALLSSPDSDGNTPLHLAAHAAATDMVRWLLTEVGALPSRNSAGQLPRQMAEPAVGIAYDETTELLKTNEEALLEHQGPLGELVWKQRRLIELLQAQVDQVTKAAAVQASTSEARILRQEQEISQFQEFVKPLIAQCLLPSLLRHVVCGDQKEAESIIVNHRDLLWCRGEVTDLSNRTFKSITAFQYAMWALDWHMWEMMLKYLPVEEASAQYRELDTHGTDHGKQANWENVIEAYQSLINSFDSVYRDTVQARAVSAQRSLPAHVVDEVFCCNCEVASRPVRSWYESALLWESGALGVDLKEVKSHQQAMTSLLAKRQEQRELLGRAK